MIDSNRADNLWVSASKVFKVFSVIWLVLVIFLLIWWSSSIEEIYLGSKILLVNFLLSICFYLVSKMLLARQSFGIYLGIVAMILFTVGAYTTESSFDDLYYGLIVFSYPTWMLLRIKFSKVS